MFKVIHLIILFKFLFLIFCFYIFSKVSCSCGRNHHSKCFEHKERPKKSSTKSDLSLNPPVNDDEKSKPTPEKVAIEEVSTLGLSVAPHEDDVKMSTSVPLEDDNLVSPSSPKNDAKKILPLVSSVIPHAENVTATSFTEFVGRKTQDFARNNFPKGFFDGATKKLQSTDLPFEVCELLSKDDFFKDYTNLSGSFYEVIQGQCNGDSQSEPPKISYNGTSYILRDFGRPEVKEICLILWVIDDSKVTVEFLSLERYFDCQKKRWV